MEVLYLVIPLALVIAAAAVGAFVWMVRSGQLDDLDSPPIRMLFEDAPSRPKEPPRDATGEPADRQAPANE